MINTIFYFPDSDAAYKRKVEEQQISTHTISLVPNDDSQTGRIYKNNILYSDGKLNPETVSQTILNGDTIYNDFYNSKLYNVIDEMLTSRMNRLEKWVDDVLNRIKNGATEDVIVMGEPLSVERDGKRYPKVWVYKNDEEKEITEDLIKKNYSNVPKGAYCKRKDMILKFVEGILQSIEETDEITYPFTTAGNSNTAVVVGPDGEPVDLDNIQPGDSGTIKDDDGDDERWIIGAMSTNPDLVKVTVEGDEPNKVVHWEVINNPDKDTRVSIIIFYNIAPDEIISMTVKHVAAKSITVNTTLEYMRVNKQSNQGDFTYSIVWPEGAATELLNSCVKVKWDSNPEDRVTSQIPVKVTPNQEGSIEVIAKILVDNISGSVTLPVKSGAPTVIDDGNGTITTGDWDIESVAFETITPPVEIEGVVKQDSEWFYAGKKAGKENEVEYYVKDKHPDELESVKITITFKDGGSKDVIVDIEGTGWVNVPGTITPSNPELSGDGDNEGTIDVPTGLTIKSFDVSYNPSTVFVEGEDKTNEFFEVKKLSDTRLSYKALLQPDNDVIVTITIHYNESDKTSTVTITVKGTGWPESAIDKIFANVNIAGPESIIKGETADYSIDLGQYANRTTVTWSTISGTENNIAVNNFDITGTSARGTFKGVNVSTGDGVKAIIAMGNNSVTKTKNVSVLTNVTPITGIRILDKDFEMYDNATAELAYEINPKEGVTYTGVEWESTNPSVLEVDEGGNLTAHTVSVDTDVYIKVTALNDPSDETDDVDSDYIKITVKHYVEPVTVIELTESNTTVTIDPTESVYTGKEIKPIVTVTHDDAVLTANDYDVTYSNNKNVGTATATITGKGTYTGSITKTFTITKKSLTVRADNKSVTRGESAPDYTVTYDGFVEGESAATYNFEPSISCEYTSESTGSSYVIEVTGGQLDNYNCKYANGTLTVSEIPTATVTTAPRANQLTYTGGPQGLVTGGTASNGTMRYTVSNTRPDINAFTETIPAGKDAGTYTVWFYAKGNDGYNDSAINSVQVAIHPKRASISYATSNVEKTVGDAPFTNQLSNDCGASVTYSSSTPGVATVNETTGEVTIISAGTTQITATAAENANYEYTTSTASYTLTVRPNVIDITDNANITVDDIPAQTYTGSAITPAAVVKNNGTAMVKDTDYTVAYSDNVNAGTAKVTITGKGGYTGSKEKNFTINKANLTITADNDTIVKGSPIPTYTANFEGFKGTDRESNLTGELEFACDYTIFSEVGTYDIVPRGVSSNNYNIEFVKGVLTVEAKPTASITTPPVAKVGLTANGQLQEIVTPAVASGGVPYYLITNTDTRPANKNGFAAATPVAKDAGTYYVWCYAKGDESHSDSEIGRSVQVSIATETPTEVTVTGIADSYEVEVGSYSAPFRPVVTPSGNTITFDPMQTNYYLIESSSGQYAIKGIAATSSPVTVNVNVNGETKKTFTITVKAKAAAGITSVSIGRVLGTTIVHDTDGFTLAIDKYNPLVAEITPSAATDKTVTWSSSNPSVVTVDSDGTVHSISAGTAVITATSNADSTKKDSITITVEEKRVMRVTVDPAETTINIGSTKQLSSTVEFYNFDDTVDDDVIWSSEDENIATVSDTGLVTAVNPGETYIKAVSTDSIREVGEESAEYNECHVIVNDISFSLTAGLTNLTEGGTTTITPTLGGYSGRVRFDYTSSNPDALSISPSYRIGDYDTMVAQSEATCKYVDSIKGVTVTVKATLLDGSNTVLEESCEIFCDPPFAGLTLLSGIKFATANMGAKNSHTAGTSYSINDTTPITILNNKAEVTINGEQYKWTIPTKDDFVELLNNTSVLDLYYLGYVRFKNSSGTVDIAANDTSALKYKTLSTDGKYYVFNIGKASNPTPQIVEVDSTFDESVYVRPILKKV